MQCSNCHFENMPGTPACGRCGTSLRLEAAAIGVHPPRAGACRKWMRRQLPLGRVAASARELMSATGSGVRGAVTAVGGRQAAGVFDVFRQPLGVLWRLAVPGWAHYYLGLPQRGRWFFWGFLALLVPGLLFLGTGWGALLIGLAFSVHAAAVLDVFNQSSPPQSVWRQIFHSFGVSILLFVLVYIPVGRVISLFAEPQIIQISVPPLKAGDVLLVNNLAYRLSEPVPGDVVLVYGTEYRYETTGANGRGVINYVYAGPRIDRVIAGPGDQVLWNAGRLTINGRLSLLRPLNPRQLPKQLEIKVPSGHYLVFATTVPNFGPPGSSRAWEALSCVRRENVLGRVYVRTHPLSRFGRVSEEFTR